MQPVGDPFLDELAAALTAAEPRLIGLEERVSKLLSQLTAGRHRPESAESLLARRYFLLYAVPVIDAARLLDDSFDDAAAVYTAAHLCLGLHVRFCDYVIDRDRSDTLRDTALALAYYCRATELLASRGFSPAARMTAMLLQYFDYEEEVVLGHEHDASSLWRRVSPLCVVPETVIAWSALPRDTYRRFLSWSLLAADCHDFLKDLRAGRTTPVTRNIEHHLSGTLNDAAAIARTIGETQSYLLTEEGEIVQELNRGGWPLWEVVFLRLAEALGVRPQISPRDPSPAR